MTTRALRTLLAAALAVLLTPALGVAAPARATAPALDGAALQRSLDAIAAAGMPGAFAEVRAGAARWRGATGFANLDNGREMRPGLRHRVGSITKTFVATVLLQLAGEGRLDLDDPVRRWLPRVAGLDPRVTVRMLLQHNSGINDYDHVILATPEQIVENRHYTPWELVRIGLSQPRLGEPGEVWSYSNTNYVLAGLVLERATGRDAEDVIRQRVIRPLGLRDTYFPGRSPDIRGPHARAYVPWTDGLRDFTRYRMGWAWTAGELISSTADLNRFYRALLGGRLLRSAQLAEMKRTVPMDPAQPAAGSYGLGLFALPTPCGTAYGHDGGTIGHLTISLHSEDARRQATLAMNMAFYQTSPDETHPIDAAAGAFLIGAFCGAQAASTRADVPALRGPASRQPTLPGLR